MISLSNEMLEVTSEKALKLIKDNKCPKYWTKEGVDRSELIRELGGFTQKKFLHKFY